MAVVTIVIVPLLLPTLLAKGVGCRDHCHCPAPFTYSVGKRGCFTRSPLVAFLYSNIAVDVYIHSLIQNKSDICR